MNNMQKQRRSLDHFLAAFKVTNGKHFALRDYPYALPDKKRETIHLNAQQALKTGIDQIIALQDKLYAEQKTGLLLVLQAMDAAGKDGTIKHVMGAINPQGCTVTPFKTPTPEEHAHDFLWRCIPHLPRRGMISIFNRSYYEEVLAVKVHPEWLQAEGFSADHCTAKFWKHRYASIVHFEQHLAHNHTAIVKIFLHLSYGEQRKRLLARLDEPSKNWKFSEADLSERGNWDAYQKAYETAIQETATEEAPWYVVPADHKDFARFVVMCILLEKLLDIDPHYPHADPALQKSLPRLRDQLAND